MEYTQQVQRGALEGKNYFQTDDPPSPLPLFSSRGGQGEAVAGAVMLRFDPYGADNAYPIKIVFLDGTQQQPFDFPPGELQYLQKVIDIVLQSKAEYIERAKKQDDRQ